MQKLSAKLKNTPTDASLVCSPVNLSLNKDQSLSVTDIVLTDNNLEVNRSQHTERQDLRLPVRVYVLNMRGQPLMPTTPRNANNFLKEGKAKAVKRNPFTIQLLYVAGETKQEIDFGLDPGFQNVGFSASPDDKEVILSLIHI